MATIHIFPEHAVQISEEEALVNRALSVLTGEPEEFQTLTHGDWARTAVHTVIGPMECGSKVRMYNGAIGVIRSVFEDGSLAVDVS